MGVLPNSENILWLSVTKGRMVNKKKNIDTGGYLGKIEGIREKAGEYEGQPTLKIEVKMRDPENNELAIVQFTKESWFSLGFFSRIRQVNLEKPFTIGVLASEQNEKMSFCYLKQTGHKNSKGTETFEADKSFPKYEKVKVSGKDVLDWTKPFAEMDAIMKHLNERLTPAGTTAPATAGDAPADGDDLPF